MNNYPEGDNSINAPWDRLVTFEDRLIEVTLSYPITVEVNKEGEILNDPIDEIKDALKILFKDANCDISVKYI